MSDEYAIVDSIGAATSQHITGANIRVFEGPAGSDEFDSCCIEYEQRIAPPKDGIALVWKRNPNLTETTALFVIPGIQFLWNLWVDGEDVFVVYGISWWPSNVYYIARAGTDLQATLTVEGDVPNPLPTYYWDIIASDDEFLYIASTFGSSEPGGPTFWKVSKEGLFTVGSSYSPERKLGDNCHVTKCYDETGLIGGHRYKFAFDRNSGSIYYIVQTDNSVSPAKVYLARVSTDFDTNPGWEKVRDVTSPDVSYSYYSMAASGSGEIAWLAGHSYSGGGVHYSDGFLFNKSGNQTTVWPYNRAERRPIAGRLIGKGTGFGIALVNTNPTLPVPPSTSMYSESADVRFYSDSLSLTKTQRIWDGPDVLRGDAVVYASTPYMSNAMSLWWKLSQGIPPISETKIVYDWGYVRSGFGLDPNPWMSGDRVRWIEHDTGGNVYTDGRAVMEDYYPG